MSPTLSTPAHRLGENPATNLESGTFLFPGILGVNCQILVAGEASVGGGWGCPVPVTAGSTTDPLWTKAEPIRGVRGAPKPIRGACSTSVRTYLRNGGKHQKKEQWHRGRAGDTPEGTTACGWSPELRKWLRRKEQQKETATPWPQPAAPALTSPEGGSATRSDKEGRGEVSVVKLSLAKGRKGVFRNCFNACHLCFPTGNERFKIKLDSLSSVHFAHNSNWQVISLSLFWSTRFLTPVLPIFSLSHCGEGARERSYESALLLAGANPSHQGRWSRTMRSLHLPYSIAACTISIINGVEL